MPTWHGSGRILHEVRKDDEKDETIIDLIGLSDSEKDRLGTLKLNEEISLNWTVKAVIRSYDPKTKQFGIELIKIDQENSHYGTHENGE